MCWPFGKQGLISGTKMKTAFSWYDIVEFRQMIKMKSFFISVPGIYATMWFRIPESVRTEKELRKRFGIFLVSRLYDMLVAWVYVYFTLLFIVIPSDYQPILGLVCPLLRELLLRILNFITYRAGGGKNVKMGKFFLVQGPI